MTFDKSSLEAAAVTSSTSLSLVLAPEPDTLDPCESGALGAPGLEVPRHDAGGGTEESTDIPLKPHYVYVLIDPRDQEVFYVGKGQNGRLRDHENAARNDAKESEKNERILSIRDAGLEVTGRVIGRFDGEPEAFAVEAVLIHWMYGRRNENGQLTNIQAGHGHLHIRRRDNLGEQLWLDVPKRIRVERGESGYSNKMLQLLLDNGIPDKAFDVVERVRNGLAQRRIELWFDEPRVVESGRFVASVATLAQDVILRLQFSATSLTTNLRATAEGTRRSREVFSQAIVQRGLRPMDHGRYAWLDDWCNNGLSFDATEAILDRIQHAHQLFCPQVDPAADVALN